MQIRELQLFTHQLEKQKTFYTEKLGLRLVHSTPDSFRISAGNSVLTFQKSLEKMHYHFAFNIPANQIKDALRWTKKHLNVIPMEGEEVIDFPSWNAQAVYFEDADGNILEFIGRKNLGLSSSTPFSPLNIQCISEIGVPSLDIKSFYETVKEKASIQLYSGDFERFCAIGTETGLFILMNYRVKKWIPTMADGFPYPFSAKIMDDEHKPFLVNFHHENLTISRQSDCLNV